MNDGHRTTPAAHRDLGIPPTPQPYSSRKIVISFDGAIDRDSSESKKRERSGRPSLANNLTCSSMCCRDFKKPHSRGDMWLITVASMVFIWRSFRGLHHKSKTCERKRNSITRTKAPPPPPPLPLTKWCKLDTPRCSLFLLRRRSSSHSYTHCCSGSISVSGNLHGVLVQPSSLHLSPHYT